MENSKKIPTIKKYIKKDGVEICKEYDQKKYNDAYYIKNKVKFLETYLCPSCHINVLKTNKSNHLKTKKHIYYEHLVGVFSNQALPTPNETTLVVEPTPEPTLM